MLTEQVGAFVAMIASSKAVWPCRQDHISLVCASGYKRHLILARLNRQLAKLDKPKKKPIANPNAGIEKEPMPERRPGQTLNNYARRCVGVMNRNIGFTGGKSASRRARAVARRKPVVEEGLEEAEESEADEDKDLEDEDLENDVPAVGQTLKGWLSNNKDEVVQLPTRRTLKPDVPPRP